MVSNNRLQQLFLVSHHLFGGGRCNFGLLGKGSGGLGGMLGTGGLGGNTGGGGPLSFPPEVLVLGWGTGRV